MIPNHENRARIPTNACCRPILSSSPSRTIYGKTWAVRLAIGIALLAQGTSAHATWSFVIADTETKELAVATVTCVENLDLLAVSPVVIVGKGAATCQAFADFDGIRRPLMRQGIQQMDDPGNILVELAQITGHQQRQYGFVDTLGRSATFTGSLVFTQLPYAEGKTGSSGNLVYAIQGNVITGNCVVRDIENAIIDTTGDLPAKVIAGVEAARNAGGDGRCSCSPAGPSGCGCPPTSFTKTGHIGGIILSRPGDTDDAVCNVNGCADGEYFLRLNVAGQDSGDPPPTDQLIGLFDTWRAGLIGRIDAVASEISFSPPTIPADGQATSIMRIEPRDWQGGPVTQPVVNISIEHASGSAGSSDIGAVTAEPDGSYTAPITAGTESGTDVFRIVVDDGIRPVTIAPDPRIEVNDTGAVPSASVWGLCGLLLSILCAGHLVFRRTSRLA